MTWLWAIFSLTAGGNRPGHRNYRVAGAAKLPRGSVARVVASSLTWFSVVVEHRRCRADRCPRHRLRRLLQPAVGGRRSPQDPLPCTAATAAHLFSPQLVINPGPPSSARLLINPGPPWLITLIFSLARQFLLFLTAIPIV